MELAIRCIFSTVTFENILFWQSKDKLINSLKEGSAGTSEAGTSNLVAMEVEELKGERDMLREEVQQSNAKIEQLRTELQVGDTYHIVTVRTCIKLWT